jgi:hypothetical protein
MAIQTTNITLDGLVHTLDDRDRVAAQLVNENDNAFSGTNTFSGAVNASGVNTFTGGILNQNVTAQSGTAAENLTAVATDTLWHAATAQAGAITLPQATANNAGMVITVMAGANWSATAFKLGFANGGSTVMNGQLTLGAIDGSEAVDAFRITASSKSIEIDSDDATAGGGAVGSIYRFYYISANLVFVEAHGMCTTGTPALDANASTTTGTS